ncbi:S8 family serine peptidase, partial [Staphylococcus aureus]
TSNPDIKVWNLSLGSNKEKPENFISPEASILDKIQYDNNVIFIVSGTNKPLSVKGSMSIGAPADSINSIVVNSVDIENNPATYSRE